MSVSFDWSVKFGDVLVIIGCLVAAVSFLFRKGSDFQRLQIAVTTALSEIAELKQEVSQIGIILTQVAVQNERMDNMGQRMNMMDRRTDDLRRGQGWITAERKTLDGEY